jgi:hypothetical protein
MDGLQKTHNLRHPRVHITRAARGRIKGVAIRGRAEFLSDSPERRVLATRFLDKYHPHLERYWGGRAMPADRVMFRVVPQQVRTWGPD